MRWVAGLRLWRACAWSAERLGADRGVPVGSPFLDRDYLAALGQAGGRSGWGDRTATMRALFSDLLPRALLERRTKATFSGPFYGPHAHAFARDWDGRTGIDLDTTDPDVLRAVWTSAAPHFGSGMSLQAAWLATVRARD
jgi:asparagine synthase (glutamine-hydrolysing)